MDYSNLIIAVCTGIGTVIAIVQLIGKKFDKIDERFARLEEKIDERFARLEENMDFRFNKVDERFQKAHEKLEGRFSRIDEKLEKIQEDITDVKERLSFLEASSIYTMPSDPPKPTTRSEIAKAMWRKRRAKQIEKK